MNATKLSEFNVGEMVNYTNGNGLQIGIRKIVGVEENPIRGTTYYLEPSDSPWFAVNEDQLSIVHSGMPAATQANCNASTGC